jgi:hypothetical protein
LADNFTCYLQLAKHDLNEIVNLGQVTYEQFLKKFRQIDWEFEADRLQFLRRTWPAISVTNEENGAILWSSAYRPLPPDCLDEDSFRHSMAIWHTAKLDNPPNPPDVTRFDSRGPLVDCYFETFEPGVIEDLFRLFFRNDYEGLYKRLFSLDVFESEGQ